jgi:hypothetical protein
MCPVDKEVDVNPGNKKTPTKVRQRDRKRVGR